MYCIALAWYILCFIGLLFLVLFDRVVYRLVLLVGLRVLACVALYAFILSRIGFLYIVLACLVVSCIVLYCRVLS